MTPSELWAGRQCPDMESPLRGAYLSGLLEKAARAFMDSPNAVIPWRSSAQAGFDQISVSPALIACRSA